MRCCISTTSSQRPNLRPTSRSTPTSWKPHARWSPIDASCPPRSGHDGVKAVGGGHRRQLGRRPRPTPRPLAVAPRRPNPRRWCDRPGRGRYGDSEPNPRTRSWSSTATTAGWARPCSSIQASWSSAVASHHVEGDGGAEHLAVVDGPDGLGVDRCGQTVVHGCILRVAGGPLAGLLRPGTMDRLRTAGVHAGASDCADSAPLAQSAEHSHGKAGVVGSIPTGGSAA